MSPALIRKIHSPSRNTAPSRSSHGRANTRATSAAPMIADVPIRKVRQPSRGTLLPFLGTLMRSFHRGVRQRLSAPEPALALPAVSGVPGEHAVEIQDRVSDLHVKAETPQMTQPVHRAFWAQPDTALTKRRPSSPGAPSASANQPARTRLAPARTPRLSRAEGSAAPPRSAVRLRQ